MCLADAWMLVQAGQQVEEARAAAAQVVSEVQALRMQAAADAQSHADALDQAQQLLAVQEALTAQVSGSPATSCGSGGVDNANRPTAVLGQQLLAAQTLTTQSLLLCSAPVYVVQADDDLKTAQAGAEAAAAQHAEHVQALQATLEAQVGACS